MFSLLQINVSADQLRTVRDFAEPFVIGWVAWSVRVWVRTLRERLNDIITINQNRGISDILVHMDQKFQEHQDSSFNRIDSKFEAHEVTAFGRIDRVEGKMNTLSVDVRALSVDVETLNKKFDEVVKVLNNFKV